MIKLKILISDIATIKKNAELSELLGKEVDSSNAIIESHVYIDKNSIEYFFNSPTVLEDYKRILIICTKSGTEFESPISEEEFLKLIS